MLPRALTALVGIPILLSAIWWGGLLLSALVAVVAVLGIREFYRLLPPGTGPLPVVLGALWCVALVLGGQVSTDTSGFLKISACIWLTGTFVALLWLIALHPGRRHLVASLYLIGGPLCIGFLLAHSLVLREAGGSEDLARNWLLLALVVAVLAVPQVVSMESTLRPTDRVIRTARSRMRNYMPPAMARRSY